MDKAITIIGGGPVGWVCALSMPKYLSVQVLEARSQGAAHNDTRALALSHGSRLILEKLDVWSAVASDAVAINTIHVSQRGGLGRTVLKAGEHDLPSLGYVLPYGKLCAALEQAAALSANIQAVFEASVQQVVPAENATEITIEGGNVINTPLAIVADGGRSLPPIAGIEKQEKAYGHDAIVSKVSAELPHDNIAYERFTPQGPMALLPHGERDFSLVWTGAEASIDALMTLDDAAFLNELHTAFGDRVGRFLSMQKRLRFPLKYATLNQKTAPHLAIIGNAAQTMHPVAGQGFNIGLRDAVSLAKLADAHQVGSSAMLSAYQQARQRDTRGGLLFTDFLVNIFSNDTIGLGAMRGAGLAALEVFQPAKRFLVNRMTFGA